MGVKITVAGIEYLNSEHSEVVENQHITTVDCPFPFRQKLIAAYKREGWFTKYRDDLLLVVAECGDRTVDLRLQR